MKTGRVVVITGMHRSGTSLVTGLLQQAGVDIGRELLPANRGNPYGYLEDTEFLDFQEQLLRARGLDMFVTAPVDFAPTAAEIERAKSLISARANRPIWGWKDPRTSLFLEFWDQLLPEASYIFLYRHPLEVVLSLMRRGDFSQNGRIELGLQSWCVYNESIIRFVEKKRDNCLLAHIYGVAGQPESFITRLRHQFQLHLPQQSAELTGHYRSENLNRVQITARAEHILRHIYPIAVNLYHQLENLADVPAPSFGDNAAPVPELSGLAEVVAGLKMPVEAEPQPGLLLLLATALAPDTVQQFYTDLSRSLRAITAERDQLYDNGPITAYETILNSQDLLTRRWISLTLTNLKHLFFKPRQILFKLKRWYRFRIKGERVTLD